MKLPTKPISKIYGPPPKPEIYYGRILSVATWYHPAWIRTMREYHRMASSNRPDYFRKRRDKLKQA